MTNAAQSQQPETDESIYGNDYSHSDLVKSLFTPKQSWPEQPIELWRVFLPYCLQRVEDDANSWVILNRNYTPIGCFRKTHDGDVFYPDYAVPIRITQKRAESISFYQDIELTGRAGENIFLYDDGSRPFGKTSTAANRKAYFERLSALEKLETIKPKLKRKHRYRMY